jgi:hypothetical protein
MKYDITHALSSLVPGSQWVVRGDNYSDIEWLGGGELPSEEDLFAEVERLQAEYDAKQYQRDRSKEYPDFKDYLDGIVKGDQDQIDAYIAACLAVKEKYPKPA